MFTNFGTVLYCYTQGKINSDIYIIEQDPIIYMHGVLSHNKTEYWYHRDFHGMCLIDRREQCTSHGLCCHNKRVVEA